MVVDKEEFLAWKANRVTEWVLQRLLAQTKEQAQALQDNLLNQVTASPSDWKAQQAPAAYLKGRFDAAVLMVESDRDDFLTEKELEEIEQRDKAQKGKTN